MERPPVSPWIGGLRPVFLRDPVFFFRIFPRSFFSDPGLSRYYLDNLFLIPASNDTFPHTSRHLMTRVAAISMYRFGPVAGDVAFQYDAVADQPVEDLIPGERQIAGERDASPLRGFCILPAYSLISVFQSGLLKILSVMM